MGREGTQAAPAARLGRVAVVSTIVACVATVLIDPFLFSGRGEAPADESDSVFLLQQTKEVQKGQKPVPAESAQVPRPKLGSVLLQHTMEVQKAQKPVPAESAQAPRPKLGSAAPGTTWEDGSCADKHELGAQEVQQQTWIDIGAVAQFGEEATVNSSSLAPGDLSLAPSEDETRPDLEVDVGRRGEEKSRGKGGIARSEVIFFCIFSAVGLAGIAVRELWEPSRDKQPSGSVAAGDGSFAAGQRVVVTQPFASDTEPSVLMQKGEIGVIQKVDGQGDLLVRFDGREMLQWVFGHSFHKLAARPAGEVFGGHSSSKA